MLQNTRLVRALPVVYSHNTAPARPTTKANITPALLPLTLSAAAAPEPLASPTLAVALAPAAPASETVTSGPPTTTVLVEGSAGVAEGELSREAVASVKVVLVLCSDASVVVDEESSVDELESVVVVDVAASCVVDAGVLDVVVLVVKVLEELETFVVVETAASEFLTWNQFADTASPNPAALTNPLISKSIRFDKSAVSSKNLAY
jgi:hypothetical protein